MRKLLTIILLAGMVMFSLSAIAQSKEHSDKPAGWEKGKKKGWKGSDVPPGLAKKQEYLGKESKNYQEQYAKEELNTANSRRHKPKFWFKNKHWLKKHPKICKKLMANDNWLNDHPKVAESLYRDRKFLNDHPKVAESLYGNRKWLNNHPKAAKKLYRNREFLNAHPKIARKAYSHKEFLKKHPRIAKDAEHFHKKHPALNKRSDKPAGWEKGKKKGWKGSDVPPGLAKKKHKAAQKKHKAAQKKHHKAIQKTPKKSGK